MTTVPTPTQLPAVACDLYRDIHKGIRAELFAVTTEAARLDPASEADRRALAAHVDAVTGLLVDHAGHEDGHIQPVVEVHLPALAEQVSVEHDVLEGRMDLLREMAATAAAPAPASGARPAVHRLHLELASFTAAYLQHQDVEERVIMPALEVAIGVEATVAIHGAVVGSIPPAELAACLALMLPAMNVDDRVEMLAGMRAAAPPEAFAEVMGLAASVLLPADHAVLVARLDAAPVLQPAL